jgi:hypothetical protein
MICDQVSVLHVDMLRTTTRASFGPTGRTSAVVFRDEGVAVADGFLGAGWVLMLVFAVGGFAGMVLAALMATAGAESAAEERRD